MADEYIRRQDAVMQLSHNKRRGDDEWELAVASDMDIIRKLPSADVVQIVHGRWMPQKGGGLCCSECGRYALDEPDGNFIHVSVPSKFCPHCGAKMDAYGEG